MEILKKAFGNNKEQIVCSSWVDGALMVLAGPGAGKTRVVTHRIGYLLRLFPNAVFRVLALTFTNRASEEMRARLQEIPGYLRGRAWTGTFHGFCTYLLRQYSCYIDTARSFTTIDDTDQLEIIADIQTAANLRKAESQNIRSLISYAKCNLLTPEEFRSTVQSEGGSVVPALYYEEYEKRMRASNLLDYDDLIWRSIQLLRDVPAVRRIVRTTYRFVLVDECQDTTLAQHELITLLVQDKNPNLFAVADENQSIFEWNNARIQNLTDMIKRYGMEVMNLNRSYRCPPEVLRLANRIILKDGSRIAERVGELVSEKQERPGCVSIQICESDDDEARHVVSTIQIGVEAGRDPGSFAVIGRTRFTFRRIESLLCEAGIPHVLVGDSGFLKSPIVATHIAALRLLANPEDAESLRQLVGYLSPNDVGGVSAAIQWCIANHQPLGESIVRIGETAEFADRIQRTYELHCRLANSDSTQFDALEALAVAADILEFPETAKTLDEKGAVELENLELLWEIARKFHRQAEDRSLSAFVARLSLERRGDVIRNVEVDSDHVKLLTVHAAKGTEYPVVIIVALENGIFPYYRSEQEGRIDEERRNFFVAMTRAEERLILSAAKTRKDSYGRPWPKKPSRFLQEIEADFKW